MGMQGIRTASPSKGPDKIVASIMYSILVFFTASRVPLQSFGGLIFRKSIIGTPIFSCITCGVNPGRSREFKIQMDN